MIDIAYARELAKQARETLPNANPWEVSVGPPGVVNLPLADRAGGTCYLIDGTRAHIMACYTWSVPNARFLTWLYNNSNELIGAVEQRERLLVTAGQLVMDVQAARDQAEAAKAQVEKLTDALRWYADAYNYARLGDETAIQRDGGVRAVRALGETGDQAVAALVNKEGK